jgi:hypothetical protein
MKTKLIVLIYFLLFLPASCYPVRFDGPYKGKVIDADTGQPIESVVVLGVWYKEYPTAAGSVSSYYDAMETVTDKNGEFEISGLGLKVMSFVAPMRIVIFKAGYENIGYVMWKSFKTDEILKERIKWKGDRAIISIKKWTLEERWNRWRNIFGSPYVNIPDEKQKLLLKEIEKEEKEIGR